MPDVSPPKPILASSAPVSNHLAELHAVRDQVVQALQNTQKPGAQDLLDEVGKVVTAVEQLPVEALSGADALTPQTAVGELERVLTVALYWTDKALGTRLRRFWDRWWKQHPADTLATCAEQLKDFLLRANNAGERRTLLPTFAHGSSHPTQSNSPSQKDVFLGSLKLFMQRTAGVAEGIPDPIGKIIKAASVSCVGIMEVLEGVAENRDDAKKLGGHISSLVQAILQYLPRDTTLVPNVAEHPDEHALRSMLETFASTLINVSDGLRTMNSQGRFSAAALHERNRVDLEDFKSDIDRAFQRLQLQLHLKAFRTITEQHQQNLYDRLGAADNGAQEKAPSTEELLCLPGTRTDILKLIDDWIEDPSPSRMLWLNGVAGCGKTTIAATVYERQKALCRTTSIFYCTAANQPRCNAIIPTLAYWLADSSYGSLEKYIRDAIGRHPRIATLPLAEQIKLLLAIPLKSIAPGAPPVVLVIDALDEWYDMRKASVLVSMLGQMGSELNVKILLTSRDMKHIRDSLPKADGAPILAYPLDEERIEAVEGDISIYLAHNLSIIRQTAGLKEDWPTPTQFEALVRKSEHLFQFAATVLRYIRLGYPPDALNAVLSSVKTSNLKELDYLYLAILQSVFATCLNDVTAPVLEHVLRCLVCSTVPIGLNVIAYLWCDTSDYEDDYIRIRQSALGHLGSFLIVPDDPNMSIRFLHTSFVDFITDPNRCTDDRFFVDTTQSHAYLARRCLERLNRDLKQNICSLKNYQCGIDGTDGSWLSKPNPAFDQIVAAAIRPGLQYASLHWTHHLEVVPASPTPVELLPLIQTFTSTHTLHWIEILAFLHSVLSVGHPASRKAADWCMRVSGTDLSESIFLFRDTTRFIGLFADILSLHPLMLYEYVLPFAPTESMLRKTYGTRHDLRFKVIRGPMQKRWPAQQWTATHGGMVFCVAVSPDGLIIASGGDDHIIKLWDAASGMPKGEPLEGHTGWVRSVIFNRDGKLLVSSSDDKTIRIWDVETGRARGDPLTGHTDQVRSVALSPDDTVVASGSDDGTVRFWGLESGGEMGEPLEPGAGRVHSVAFTPGGSTVVFGCGDGRVRRWNMNTKKAVGEPMMGHTARVLSVCVSPDGSMIASGSGDSNIRMWDAETGEQIGAPLEGHTSEINSVAFSPAGESVVSGSDDMTIRLWDERMGKQRRKALTGHTNWVRAVAFTLDGKTVVSGSWDGTVRAWDVEEVEDEGEEVEGHLEYVCSVAFTSDARFVATGSADGSMMVWSAETGSFLGKVEGGYGNGRLEFSADGRALREEGMFVREWDVSGAVEGTGAEIRQVEPDGTLEFPKLEVEKLRIDGEGWIKRGERKWLWLPQAFELYNDCHLLGTKLVLQTLPVAILDVAGLP